jgi:phosphoglycolate phosphatase
MPYQLAAFDFDGTLADSFHYFVSNVNALARRHHFREMDPSRLEEYRGLEPRELMRTNGVPMWKMPFIAKDFMALMSRDLSQVRPFAGIVEELEALSAKGISLAIVTSNSEENVRRVMGDEFMRHVRHLECGASMFGKKHRLERVLRAAGVDRGSCIYVGDQTNDGEAARDAGMAFGAVQWGYASGESLDRHAPALHFHAVSDLRQISP